MLKERLTKVKDEINKLNPEQHRRWLEHYFPNKWTHDPDGNPVGTGGTGGREGSAAFMKKQKMSLKEGIDAGWTPKTTDPTEALLLYETNAYKFIANERIFQKLQADGNVKYLLPGNKPEGWEKLEGRHSRGGPGGALDAYAPEGIARVYNTSIARGMAGSDIYKAARYLNAQMMMFKLGANLYHGTMETLYEAPASAISQAADELFTAGQHVKAGDVRSAGREAFYGVSHAVMGAIPGASPIKFTRKGGQMFDVYKDMNPKADAHMQELVNLFTESGGRFGKSGTSALGCRATV